MPLPEDLSAPGRRVVFVYYRVQPSHAAVLQQAFSRVRTRIEGWQPRLMRKVAEDGDRGTTTLAPAARRQADLQTWMEVYWPSDEVPQANADLQSFIDRHVREAGMFELIEGERHYEIFEPCA